jgi:ATP-binding cassette, subfamily C, bacterial CydC
MKLSKSIALGLPRDRGFVVGLAIAVLQGLSAVALLGSSAWLISRSSEQPAQVYVAIAVVGVRAFAVGRAAFRYAERMVLHDSAFRMLAALRPRLLERLIPLAPVGLTRLAKGRALQGVVADVDDLQNLPLRVVAPLVQSTFVAIISAGFLALFAPLAGVALLLAATAAIVVAVPIAARLGRNADENIAGIKTRMSELSMKLLESSALLEAYGWRSPLLGELARLESELQRRQRKSSLASGLGMAVLTALSVLATATTAWFGAQAVFAGWQPGVMLAVMALLPMAVFDVLNNLQGTAQAWNRFRAAAINVGVLLDEVPASELPAETELPAHAEPVAFASLELIGVSARYPNASRDALAPISLRVTPGDVLLVTGESGAGKSTIANVLMRFLTPSGGRILVNGREFTELSTDEIRRMIGLIEQSPTIFTGSVRQNLVLAKPEATDAEMEQALERVGLWKIFAEREGLETFVGEQGSRISGGEATRLALARALLADRAVIVLDEPTANLDDATAMQSTRELVAAAQASGAAVIVISHDSRLASLTASEVVVKKPRL